MTKFQVKKPTAMTRITNKLMLKKERSTGVGFGFAIGKFLAKLG
jgi:hypothetical protein